MMHENTVKKQLLRDEEDLATPEKIAVNCDINRWMETFKRVKTPSNKCPSFRIGKKVQLKAAFETPTGVDELKARRETLMRSSLQKQSKDKEKTRSGSYDGTKSTA